LLLLLLPPLSPLLPLPLPPPPLLLLILLLLLLLLAAVLTSLAPRALAVLMPLTDTLTGALSFTASRSCSRATLESMELG
jgi:hypothetical protein